jgi:hypothetical protein
MLKFKKKIEIKMSTFLKACPPLQLHGQEHDRHEHGRLRKVGTKSHQRFALHSLEDGTSPGNIKFSTHLNSKIFEKNWLKCND